ncbi:MAG TPA: sigma-70 family RNA polymerase sigma factor [Clostridia bacterium]|nr:sigma-70 family RNA polymerase sigma factor [Clostridia bacterium]
MSHEADLVARARRGDVDAFGALVRTHEKKIYNMAYRMLGNTEDAFDASQEAFTKAFFSLESFRGTSSFSTWLYRIAANICLDELRRRKRSKILPLDAPLSLSDGEILRELPSQAETPEQILTRKELLRDIERSILSLSPEHRLAITLRDIQGLSYEEIADLTGASLGTVKSRIHRARNALKNAILSGEHLPSEVVSRARKSPGTGDSDFEVNDETDSGFERGEGL